MKNLTGKDIPIDRIILILTKCDLADGDLDFRSLVKEYLPRTYNILKSPNVKNAKAPLSAATRSNKNPRQNKVGIGANEGDKRANEGDPDQLKKLETAAIVIYAIGLLVGILALIFWSNTLAIITAAIMSVGFVVFLCCGGKAHYFFSWVMSFLIGLGLIVLMIKKGDGNFHGFFIP